MVIVEFPNGEDWSRANWIFRQLATDMIALNPDDEALALELEKGEAYAHLVLGDLDAGLGRRIMKAMQDTVGKTLSGEVGGWVRERPEDEAGHAMYASSLIELQGLLRQALN